MTCVDCTRYVVCAKKGRHFATHTYGKNYSTTYIENVENACKDFKDKSKVIELPCKFGDTVYMVFHFNIGNVDEVIEGNIEQVVIDQKIWFKAFFERSYWKSFNAEDIGKTIFLTRDEAENALNND